MLGLKGRDWHTSGREACSRVLLALGCDSGNQSDCWDLDHSSRERELNGGRYEGSQGHLMVGREGGVRGEGGWGREGGVRGEGDIKIGSYLLSDTAN